MVRSCKSLFYQLLLVSACAGITSLSGCAVAPIVDDDSTADDDDDSIADDDDDSSAGDDDSTPDPENPFPGDSIHQGDYSGELSLTYTGRDNGVLFCAGTCEFNITGSGTLSGGGTCVVSLDGQPLEPESSVSISVLGEMTDIGNMNDGQLIQTMSYAPGEELKFYLDGSAAQGMLDLDWQGLMQLPDGDRAFAGHATGELVSGR